MHTNSKSGGKFLLPLAQIIPPPRQDFKRKNPEPVVEDDTGKNFTDIVIPFPNQWAKLPNATKPPGLRGLNFPLLPFFPLSIQVAIP